MKKPIFLLGRCIALGAFLLGVLSHGASAQVSVTPPAPMPFETVRLIVPEVFNDEASRSQTLYNSIDMSMSSVSMTANRINVVITVGNDGFPLPPTAAVDMAIGQFPTGTYEVHVTRQTRQGVSFGEVGSVTFTVPERPRNGPLWNHTDLWWDPNESGWGINVIQHGSGKIFATWFVYSADRKATWYVVPDGGWITPTMYQGVVYRTSGPEIPACNVSSCPPFDAASVIRTPVGQMQLYFHSSLGGDVATLVMTIDGRETRKGLRRQSF